MLLKCMRVRVFVRPRGCARSGSCHWLRAAPSHALVGEGPTGSAGLAAIQSPATPAAVAAAAAQQEEQEQGQGQEG